MDPNMIQNNPVMVQPQMVEPQMVDLQDPTMQVLNYNDVTTAAETESKSLSLKKAAIFLAIIGVILLGGGAFYKFMPVDEPQPTEPSETKAITPSNSAVTCTLSDESGTDHVTRSTIYTLMFGENSNLKSYTKEYTVKSIKDDTQSLSKISEETTTFTKLLKYQETNKVNGYLLTVAFPNKTSSTKIINAKIVIDFETLDVTKMDGSIMSNAIAKVDLQKDQTLETVKATLSSYGYICQ